MKKKSAGNAMAVPVMAYREPKSVRVEKASNGFVVTHQGPGGCKTMIAKNLAEVMKHQKKLLKG